MKNNALFWIITVICAVLPVTVLLIRYLTLCYDISEEEISINIGLIFRSTIIIKRSAILSVSRLYLGHRLICTIVRTAGKTAVLFCDIPDTYLIY